MTKQTRWASCCVKQQRCCCCCCRCRCCCCCCSFCLLQSWTNLRFRSFALDSADNFSPRLDHVPCCKKHISERFYLVHVGSCSRFPRWEASAALKNTASAQLSWFFGFGGWRELFFGCIFRSFSRLGWSYKIKFYYNNLAALVRFYFTDKTWAKLLSLDCFKKASSLTLLFFLCSKNHSSCLACIPEGESECVRVCECVRCRVLAWESEKERDRGYVCVCV